MDRSLPEERAPAGPVVRHKYAVADQRGAPLAGLARELRGQIPVPVVDGISAGIRMAEAVVGLQSGPHRAGAFAPPPVKARSGLSENLDAALTAAQAAQAAQAAPSGHPAAAAAQSR